MADQAHSIAAPANLPAPASLHRLSPLGCPAGIELRAWRKAIAYRIEELQDAQAALVAALDAMDVDSDLEPDADDEPSLGAACSGAADCDLERDEADDEPSLGWSDHRNQAYIATEHGLDLEAVNEDGGNILDECHDIDFGGGILVTEGGGSGEL